ncbi:MAG: hypothetical protein DMG68_21460, partial [Acidobacteria bacterium]
VQPQPGPPDTSVPIASPEIEPVAPAPAITDESIKDKILEIVADKTGYPKDMLDLDLDLEADLGIDTVKQAEMFAAVRVAYKIPRDENLKLREFPTLAHVIQFARERQPASVQPAVPHLAKTISEAKHEAPSISPPSTPKPQLPRPIVASFEATDRIPRRVPVPVLRPPLAICKPTYVTLGPGSRVVLMPDRAGAGDNACGPPTLCRRPSKIG